MAKVLAETRIGPLYRDVRVRLECKPEDLWIGAFWRKQDEGAGQWWAWDVWVCLFPCLPLRFSWVTRQNAAPATGAAEEP